MLSPQVLEELTNISKEIAQREGCFLYDLEFVGQGRGRCLRIYLDKLDGTVDIDDCTRVSRALNLRLDVEDLIPGGRYQLEVSSPGLDRPLRQRWHFERAVGSKIKLKLEKALSEYQAVEPSIEKSRNLQGRLNDVDENDLLLEFEGRKLRIPLRAVQKARVVFEF